MMSDPVCCVEYGLATFRFLLPQQPLLGGPVQCMWENHAVQLTHDLSERAFSSKARESMVQRGLAKRHCLLTLGRMGSCWPLHTVWGRVSPQILISLTVIQDTVAVCPLVPDWGDKV